MEVDAKLHHHSDPRLSLQDSARKFMCKPSQAGDELFTTNYTIFGELKHTGPIMVSTNFRTQDLTYVALTAGHVIPEYQDTMFVRNKLDNTFIPLKVSERSKWLKAKLPIKLSRRIILVSRRLRATEHDANYFQAYITNINLHYFGCTAADIPAADALNPLAYPRHRALRQLLRRSRLVGHKIGASTDLTVILLERRRKLKGGSSAIQYSQYHISISKESL